MDYLDDEQQGLMGIDEDTSEEGGLASEQELEQVDAKLAAWFLGLSGTATFLPFVLHMQQLTGPIINAILILLLFIVGIRSALLVALIPSIAALAGGLLPAILAPAVPFIMMSNAIFVVTIDWFYNRAKDQTRGYWTGVLVGAALKFAFLLLSVRFVTKLLLKQELAAKVTQLLSWPQFVTAVAGGAIAWGVLKWLKRI